jgi:hypothetical protein
MTRSRGPDSATVARSWRSSVAPKVMWPGWEALRRMTMA